MSQNSRNQGFSYYICLMIEGSGSIPLTNGSGSGRPKSTWTRVRIRIRIRIRNTAFLNDFIMMLPIQSSQFRGSISQFKICVVHLLCFCHFYDISSSPHWNRYVR
jgi:hypothetical protein